MGERIGQRNLRPHGERERLGELVVQEAAARVLAAGLGGDDSAFTPGRPVWTAANAAELVAAFVDKPDLGAGNFLVKLESQLAGCSPHALQLAAELQYLTVLPLHDMKATRKRERVGQVLRWADAAALPDEFDAALEAGVFNGGMGFTVQGWKQFGVLVSFVKAWKELPPEVREAQMSDPWAFRDMVQSVPGPKPAGQRYALTYLAFPDVFEPIINSEHRKQILKALLASVGPATGDDDRDLLALRDSLEESTGQSVDFYRSPYVEQWKPASTPPVDEPVTRRAWLVRGSSVQGANLVPGWLAEGYVSLAASQLPPVEGGAERSALKALVDEHYGSVSYSQRQQKLVEFDAFLSRMTPGDIVLTTDQGAFFLGELAGAPEYDATQVRARLRRSVRWDDVQGGIDFADLSAALAARVQSPHDLLDLTPQLLDLELLRGEGEELPVELATLPDATSALADELLLPLDWLQECVELLRDRPQLVFYGPPGTGKTFVAQALARHLAGRDAVTLVQFHPAYSYEDFFEGYRPEAGEGGTVGFRLKPGPLRRVVDQAREHPDKSYVLIVDEINRGNLARVFGELYFLLEYRDEAIDLLYSSGDEQAFTLPPNVVLIGTMNTADRSIALVDAAMRRRFSFVALHPSDEPVRGLLARWLARQGRDDLPARLLGELNRRIEESEFKVGPSYLMRPGVYAAGGIERVWRAAILPLLEEHHYGDGTDVVKRYGLPSLREAVEPVAAAEGVEDDPAS